MDVPGPWFAAASYVAPGLVTPVTVNVVLAVPPEMLFREIVQSPRVPVVQDPDPPVLHVPETTAPDTSA